MRRARGTIISMKAPWHTLGLLTVLPALLLAVLGLRAVRAERIEREQQMVERRAQTARLVDASIRSTLYDLERELQLGHASQLEARFAADESDVHFLSYERSGRLTFYRDRLYFGNLATKPTIEWSANLEQLIEQAQAAEAQGRTVQATVLYRRIMDAEPRLRDWAQLSLLHLNQQDDRQLLNEILADDSQKADRVTPGGVPLAMVACAYLGTIPPEDRHGHKDILSRTLSALRAGRWWLSLEERSVYDREINSLLEPLGTTLYPADARLEELVRTAGLMQAVPLRRDQPSQYFEAGQPSPVLIVLAPSPQNSNLWQGAALTGTALGRLLGDALNQAGALQLSKAAVQDEAGATVWGDTIEVAGRLDAGPINAIPGLRLVFQRSEVSGWADHRSLLWVGFIVILIVTMLVSLASTMRVVRREADLVRMQNDFIAGVSHEFKSPITSIRLLVERLSGGRISSRESGARYQAAIDNELVRLERHVDRLIEAQQIQAGQRQYSFGPASLPELTANAVAQVQAQADAKQIRIECEADPKLPLLQLDRTAMTEALANLIGNAVKYSSTGTRIGIDARLHHSHVCIEISDEGIGIERDDLRRIFKRFYRGKGGSQQSVKGAGLGLALVKAAVQAHGGRISVTSTPGKGSRFSIILPLAARSD